MLTIEQLNQFDEDGYLVIEDFFSVQEADELKNRALELLRDFDINTHPKTKFSTGQKSAHVGDDYFLESGDKIRFFFEEDALDNEGNLVVGKLKSINKIGHGLHVVDPLFRKFTFRDELRSIAKDVGFKKTTCLQSMVICKQPRIGGQVPPHQDSSFLYTDPPSAIGFWFALEDCTHDNGCMWFAPGSHKKFPIHKRFVRAFEGKGTSFIDIGPCDKEALEKVEFKCEPCRAGSLVLIHGAVLHKSGHNASEKSRFIYTFHMIEGEHQYPQDNWLQPTKRMEL